MPSVQIKDMPDATHRVLRMRAAAAHQSLQEYLRARLIAEAAARRSTRCWIALADGLAVRCLSG